MNARAEPSARRPNLWAQFDLDQLLTFDLANLQAAVDRLYGPQPRMNRWRLAVMLHSHGKTMAEYQTK